MDPVLRETDLFSIMKGNPCSTQDYVDVPGRFHHDIVHSIWSLMFRTKLNSIIVSSSTTAAAGWLDHCKHDKLLVLSVSRSFSFLQRPDCPPSGPSTIQRAACLVTPRKSKLINRRSFFCNASPWTFCTFRAVAGRNG